VLPVAETVRHWHASPRSAVGFLIHAATMDAAQLGARRNLTMPGVAVTVGEQIEALRAAAGEAAVKLIRRERDPVIERIVAGWPTNFDASRARSLGFRSEESFGQIIRAYLEDENVVVNP
jgi:nucleoside-diphosphate-sugar epimerase